MTIHQKICDRLSLAKTYTDDGAFLTAARILRELAADLETHDAATDPTQGAAR